MNPKLKTLLDLWPQIVAGYHKTCDHYWQFLGELNVLTEEINWYLKHDGYCHSGLEFGPFDSFFSLIEWDGEDLRQKMLEICREELTMSDPENDPEMPKQHWEQLTEKLEEITELLEEENKQDNL